MIGKLIGYGICIIVLLYPVDVFLWYLFLGTLMDDYTGEPITWVN